MKSLNKGTNGNSTWRILGSHQGNWDLWFLSFAHDQVWGKGRVGSWGLVQESGIRMKCGDSRVTVEGDGSGWVPLFSVFCTSCATSIHAGFYQLEVNFLQQCFYPKPSLSPSTGVYTSVANKCPLFIIHGFLQHLMIVISWLRLYFKQLNCFPSPSTELICCSQLFRLVVCHNLQKRWNKRENQTSELRKSVNRVGHPHSTNCPFKYMNSSYIHIPLSSLKARSILDPEGRLKVHNFSYINNVAGVNIP